MTINAEPDPHIAGRFLDAYEAASNSALPDRLMWDLWAVARSCEQVESWAPNYRDLGRADLTAAKLRNRHTAWTHYLIAQTATSSDHLAHSTQHLGRDDQPNHTS